MTKPLSTPSRRLTVRAIRFSSQGDTLQIIEQEIPATPAQITLFFRRSPFRGLAAEALLSGGVIEVEAKGRT